MHTLQSLVGQFIFGCLVLFPTIAPSAQTIPTGAELEKIILHQDSLFWTAYNDCDLETLVTFLGEETEFYHDKAGRIDGASSIRQVMQNGLCAEGENRIVRRPIVETIEVFPLAGIGAILRGQHTFHHKDGYDDDGIARFFHLWELKPTGWKMTRVFSYDHLPLQVGEEKPD